MQTDINNLNSLSSALGGESGTSLSVSLNNGQSQTINASSGTLDANGNYVFKVNSFQFNNGSTLTINGGADQYVVLNFAANAQFGGTIQLSGGITSDHVLFNLAGNNNTLQISANAATLTGTFLDANGNISIDHSVLNGRLFGGDSQNEQIVSGALINAPVSPVPEPSTMLAGALVLLPFGASTLRILRQGRRA